ncbi:hypothetical protein EY643_14990 [Halioglobus maricola]|uniref:TonB-dependent receptor n=1 Tax=Halioglobus maricola TaxID=2601894 RepID=A0A5P9NMJ8_9GAMM|nr:TonB-dependent receptor [Halioglobus maricola]QFU76849.1 hypothetical protein EY643_14990 [Halioglobus maricola]
MNRFKLKPAFAIPLLSCAPLCAPYAAYAADLALEEIIVTAQKRVETLSDTPLSIQAVSGEAMARENVFEMQDLGEQLTNVTFSNASGPSYMTIRGLGTGASNTAAEQSVGMYIDSIYVSRGYQFNAPFLDIERVEVLKGPQGILAGKNSVAGAVVIHTKRPAAETEGYVRGGYEFENEGYYVEGAVSGALTENFYARLTGQYTEEGGWLDTNTRLSSDGTILKGASDQNTNTVDVLRLSMVWDATDSLSFFGKLEASNRDIDGQHFAPLGVQPGAEGALVLADWQARDPNFDFIDNGVVSNGYRLDLSDDETRLEVTNKELSASIESESATFQFDWDVGSMGTLTGISGYSAYEQEEYYAQSVAPADWLTFQGDKGNGGDELSQYTQEFRLVSPGGETVDYVLGLFYMDRTIEQDGFRTLFKLTELGAPAFADFYNDRHFKEETTAWSAFAQLTWNINEALRLNLGVRYTDESKDRPVHSSQPTFLVDSPFNQLILDAFGSVPFTTADLDETNVSETSTDPSVSLQWDVSDDTMLYGSYTEATKAGGFNNLAPDQSTSVYDPEYATSYELGVKSFLMDGRFNVNLAVFYSEFDDLQVSGLNVETNSITFGNAAEAKSQGVEADFRFAVTSELELGGALAYLDATYDDYPGANCSTGIAVEDDCDLATNTRNAAGDKLRFAPEWTGNLYGDYRWSLSNGMQAGIRGDVVFSDDFYFSGQNDPYLVQDSFYKFNMLVELASEDYAWVLSIVGKNLTDETTVNHGGGVPQYPGGFWSNVDKPRQVFFNAQYNF